ncbi:hypothetical protein F8M41_017600 [Gigaspora margarita]|uniref:Uncharacterized protein n=1 Tax=Gigaspora margarita TaxID=4874 RepID=A0A8H4AMY6_GIGMA|nr:hypothetical protein F8M41_017600 [Gigaspora margarita]
MLKIHLLFIIALVMIALSPIFALSLNKRDEGLLNKRHKQGKGREHEHGQGNKYNYGHGQGNKYNNYGHGNNGQPREYENYRDLLIKDYKNNL